VSEELLLSPDGALDERHEILEQRFALDLARLDALPCEL
jgi:hypothetical protein